MAFDMIAFAKQQQLIGAMNTERPGTIAYEIAQLRAGKPPFICKFCGAPSWVDPVDQTAPLDYCCDFDHGNKEDCKNV